MLSSSKNVGKGLFSRPKSTLAILSSNHLCSEFPNGIQILKHTRCYSSTSSPSSPSSGDKKNSPSTTLSSSSPSPSPSTSSPSSTPLPNNEPEETSLSSTTKPRSGASSTFPGSLQTATTTTSSDLLNYSTTSHSSTTSSSTFPKSKRKDILPPLPKFYHLSSSSQDLFSSSTSSSSSSSSFRKHRQLLTYVPSHLSSYTPFQMVPPLPLHSKSSSASPLSSTSFKFPELKFVCKGMSAGPQFRKCWIRYDPQCLIKEKVNEMALYLNHAQLVTLEPVQICHSLLDVFAEKDPHLSERLAHLMFPTQESLENLSELVWNPETLHPHQVYVRDQTLRYLNVKRAVQYWCDQFEMNYLNQDLANSSASSTSTPLFLSVEHVGQFFKSNLGMDLFEVLETCLNSLLAKYPHLVVVYGLSRESLLGLGTTGKDGPFVPISLKGLELPNHHAVLLDPLSEIEHGQYRELWKHYLTHLHWTYISRSLIRAYHCPPAMHAQFHSLTHPLVSVLPGLKNYIDVSVTKQKLDTFICSLIGFMNQSKIEASSSPTSPSPSSSSSSPSPSSSSSSNTRSNQLKMLCQRLLYPGLEHDILSLPDPLSPSSSHPSHSSSTDTSLSPSHPFPFPSTSSSSGNGNGSNTAGGGGVAGTGMSPFNRILPSKYRVLRPSDVHVTLDDVIGHSQAKLALRSLIQLPLQFPHHFKHGVLLKASSNGVLLYGPPGTGKTLLAKAIAKSSQSMFITVNPSDVFDKYVGESEKYVKGLFEKARQSKPCIIFLDEVDAVFSKRDLDLNGHRRDVLNEFCMQWEGLKENHGIIVLGATNRPFDLDEAVLRRFARRVLVDLPTSMEQLAILRHHLVGEQLHPEVNLNTIVDQLQHYSGSDIKNLCVAASMAAIRELESKGEIQKDRVLHARHFLLSLKEVKASAHKNLNSISRLREFEKTLSGSKTTEFGFRHRKDT